MNSRPDVPTPGSASLVGVEGELITVWILVEPRRLEAVLEALGRLDFPVNPQIYREACVVGVRADGGEEERPTLLIEFPAWSHRLAEIHRAIENLSLPSHALSWAPLLSSLRQPVIATPAPPDSPYRALIRYRSKADRRRAPLPARSSCAGPGKS